VKFILIIVCHTKDYLSNDQQGQLARRYLRIYSIWKIPDVVQNHFLMAIVYLAHDARRVVLIASLSPLPPGGKAVHWGHIYTTTHRNNNVNDRLNKTYVYCIDTSNKISVQTLKKHVLHNKHRRPCIHAKLTTRLVRFIADLYSFPLIFIRDNRYYQSTIVI
jgi:hypothetical protein